jgi:STE20-related kinase adapter protein alpha
MRDADKKQSVIFDVECCFQHEIILTRQLQHPNVLPYHTAFVSGPEVIVVAPLMAFGSCKDLLSSHFTDGLPEAAIAFVLRDVLLGLEYIHRKGYIHRCERLNIKRL